MNAEMTVFKSCKNYDVIVNFTYSNTDYLSALLVSDYKNYILSKHKKQNQKIKKYDLVMMEYVSNKHFYKFVNDDYNSFVTFVPDTRLYLLNLYNKYLNKIVRNQKQSKWI